MLIKIHLNIALAVNWHAPVERHGDKQYSGRILLHVSFTVQKVVDVCRGGVHKVCHAAARCVRDTARGEQDGEWHKFSFKSIFELFSNFRCIKELDFLGGQCSRRQVNSKCECCSNTSEASG